MKHSDRQLPSSTQDDNGPDYVLDLLKLYNLPVTRQNYLGLAYPEGLPGDWGAEGEAGLPGKIRNK